MSADKKTLVTPTGRIVFHKNLWTQDNKGKYKASLVLDKEQDLSAIKKLLGEVARNKFADEKVIQSKKFKWGMKTPDEEAIEKFEFFTENTYILNASTQFPVEVKGTKRMSDGKLEDLIDGDIKAGDYCRFLISAFAWENTKEGVNRGVSLNLLAVQFIKEGEAFYSRQASDDSFAQVALDVNPESSASNSSDTVDGADAFDW